MSTTKQNIVIVGGGYAGIAAFNLLSSQLDSNQHNLVLVTSRPFFLHLPGAIRMVSTAEGKLEDRVLMPFPNEKFNTDHTKLVVATVTSVVEQGNEGGYLVLDNGEKVEYSILIIATGSNWEGAIAFPNTLTDTLEVINSWREQISKSNDIVLVGGGSVGLEFAGEIKDLSSTKNVTIIHGQSHLLNSTYPQSYREYTAKQFRDRGVNFVLGDYIDDLTIKNGSVTTRSGQKIPADLVIPTRGGRPNTNFLQSLKGALNASGTVKVTQTLQIDGHPRIFAAGDIIEWKEQKQAGKTANHTAVIVHNTLVLLGLKKKAPMQYKGSSELIMITNGKNSGTGYMGVLWGITLGGWLSSLIKSKSLLIDMTKKTLGL